MTKWTRKNILKVVGVDESALGSEVLANLKIRRQELNQGAAEQNLLDGAILPPYEFTLQDALDSMMFDGGVSGAPQSKDIRPYLIEVLL
ncbi:MAG TPA: hypothetical protein VMW29_04010 [Candidatus Bathyarchaeia archaeon]|nr:hypothetical protein [Candidatus Bathyarchaeia archaeon]